MVSNLKSCKLTYCPRNEETGEQVPKADEERCCNGTNLETWGKRDEHHSVQSEVDETCADEIVEPEEFHSFHLESNHCEEQNGIHKSLHYYIDYLDCHLQMKLGL